jgi:hypothetical protein
MLDATTFCTGTRIRKPGLRNVTAQHEGYLSLGAGSVEEALGATYFCVENIPMSFAPTGTEGEPAYTFLSEIVEFNPINSGVIGEMAKFSVRAESQGGALIRGILAGKGIKDATGNTATPVDLGILTDATKTMYAALHVFGGSTADTIDVTIESDELLTFLSPTTRITFDQVAGAPATYQWKTLAGPIATDTFWRAKWTTAGTLPSFDIAIVMGIFNT